MTQEKLAIQDTEQEAQSNENYRKLEKCPYCSGKLVKKGIRKKKHEEVQIYFCSACSKKITPLITKNRTYPLRIIIDSLTFYNKFVPIDKIPEIIKNSYGIGITSRTVSNWLKEFEAYAPFLRMREFAEKKYDRKDAIAESKMFHKQIYDFKFHRAKTDIILQEEFRHCKFKPLKDFLELVIAECPNQIFQQETKRASEHKGIFNFDSVKFIPKTNAAVKIANFVMQAVSNNKMRHGILQDFMVANDSVTVAAEVPVLLDADDIRHYKHELNFVIPLTLDEGEYLTGHIDLIQIRNGSIHIMDFKPSAAKERPVDQLTIYALALSRLTGLRLYHFKCAWFDDKNYYEFFPLHVVYKKAKRKRLPRDQKKLEVHEPVLEGE